MQDQLNQLYAQSVIVIIDGDRYYGRLLHDGHFWYIKPSFYITVRFSASNISGIDGNQIHLL